MEELRPQFQIHYIYNPVFDNLQITGYEGLLQNENINNSSDWVAHIHPDDQEIYKKYLASVLKDKSSATLSYTILLGASQKIRVTDFISYVPSANEQQFPVLTGLIVPSQEESHQASSLFMDKFSAGLIHDFKNLLSGVQNIVEWVMTEAQFQPQIHQALNKTIGYMDQANSLIGNVSQFLKNNADSTTENLNLVTIVRDLEILIKHTLPKEINLEITTAPETGLFKGKVSEVQELILNLCINARNAMKHGGELLKIEVFPCKQDGQATACLKVTDTGCGMNQEQMDSVFQPYYTNRKEGTGLGLWIVQEIVSKAHAKIFVDSTEGEGTCFTVHFPAIESTLDQTHLSLEHLVQEEPVTMGDMNNKTILFIEDEPLIQNAVSKWLESLGFKVYVTDNGFEALELFKQHKDELDIIIQDYILPGIKGDKLLEEFVAAKPELPVVVVSAFSGELDQHILKEKGAYTYLSKPFKMNKLLAIINEAIGQKTQV